MKVAFDASDLSTNRADGTTRYTRELAERLPRLAPEIQWDWHAPTDFDLQSHANATKHISPFIKYWTQARLPWELYRHPADVLFMPIQQLPLMRSSKMKTVAVIHDLAVHKFPQQFRRKDWVLLHWFSAQVAREADEIIAVSQATANDVLEYYGRSKHVTVVPHGVDHKKFRRPININEHELAWDKLKTWQSKLTRPYILFVGQIQPRKNITGLVGAFEILAQKDTDLQLVIAGGHGWLQDPILKRIQNSSVSQRIIVTGRVPESLLTPLYWHAEVLALPSFYEGFGMTVLEAQACGCPVVTSNVSSLPEVAGDAAILVNPDNKTEIADGISSVRQRKDQLISQGLTWAAKFTWERTTRATLEVIKSLV